MNAQQLKIDLIPQIRLAETDDKKGESFSLRLPIKFEADLRDMARNKKLSFNELCEQYLINQYSEDYKNYLLLQQMSGKTLRDLLK